ncbi:MAG: 5'/3'-nucleotidase SurE [Chitinophagales bacterium]|nr:5'/3'-nucleotidase SurE [Bacteroidota bacterium]MCB9042994.1 5'/3'-nucleotidase SurE [Chitinophagales bacterium]
MEKNRPIILVTNDDGIVSQGIRALVEVAAKFGEVYVVAPDKPQSAMGHAITISQPLRLSEVDIFGDKVSKAYECSGTPVDCVKLAVDKVLHRRPDLCLSGINHGSNAAINVIYSGTMSAAMEAAIEGINAIGFSFLNYSHHADLRACKYYAEKIIDNCLENGFPQSALLNVNIPDLPMEKIKGMKICHQANAKWEERFDERTDPQGRKYYWLTGNFIARDTHNDADWNSLHEGYVSIVPIQYDLTSYSDISLLKESWEDLSE